ncbi:recombinase family protein, partial [Clostridium botulinum C]|nr:recombinase family protein [Clostridium botulinum C]MCD3262949.1 recombinase family protein [Clostridium botulinum C]
RAKGKVIGRPQTTKEDIPSNIINAIKLLKDKKINKSECARMCNISRPTLDKYIKIIEG